MANSYIDYSAPWLSPERFRYIDREVPKISKRQLCAIKRILFWPPDKPFARCHARVRSFVRACEEKGDFSHSKQGHLCNECRCKLKAGTGTKGDFYGLGFETGHLGVGFCSNHEIRNASAYMVARNQLRSIQIYGEAEMENEYYEKVSEEEALMASRSIQARQDLDLVVQTLEKFQHDIQKKNVMTEKGKNGAQEISDKSRIELALKIADTLSKLKTRNFKLDSNEYLHYDELTKRLPLQISLGKRLFLKLKEMIIKGADDERDPLDVVVDEWMLGHKQIWQDVKTGEKK